MKGLLNEHNVVIRVQECLDLVNLRCLRTRWSVLDLSESRNGRQRETGRRQQHGEYFYTDGEAERTGREGGREDKLRERANRAGVYTSMRRRIADEAHSETLRTGREARDGDESKTTPTPESAE